MLMGITSLRIENYCLSNVILIREVATTRTHNNARLVSFT